MTILSRRGSTERRDGSGTSPQESPQVVVLSAMAAVLAAVTLELVRASGPFLDIAYSKGGVDRAAPTALATYLAPGVILGTLVLLLRRRPGALLVVGSAFFAILRVALQAAPADARPYLGLAAVATAIALLVLVTGWCASSAAGAEAATTALLLGFAMAVGAELALGTWDPVWRDNLLAWLLALLPASALVVMAWTVRRSADQIEYTSGRLWALGLLLALEAMVLANPGFAASLSTLSLGTAGTVTAAGLLLAAVTTGWFPARQHAGRLLGRSLFLTFSLIVILLLATRTIASLSFGGAGLLCVMVLGQLTVAQAVALTLRRGPTRKLGLAAALSASAAGLLTILPLLVYQIDYARPLGFPNALVVVAAAALLGLAGAAGEKHRTAPDEPVRQAALFGVAAAVVAAGALFEVSGAAVGAGGTESRSASTGRALVWNLHYGVGPEGTVDLEGVARVIRRQDPDVVLLQEVSRGWVQGGGSDMATWLADRLDMEFAFAPAADRQFGNVILARNRPADVASLALPFGGGPQHRSAIAATVDLGGRSLTVASVHLQNDKGHRTRILQIRALLPWLHRQAGSSPLLFGGDFNAEPGWREISMITDAGFSSAVDEAGHPGSVTEPSIEPDHRIDWVFGRGVQFRHAKVLVGARQSDHLPIVVDLSG